MDYEAGRDYTEFPDSGEFNYDLRITKLEMEQLSGFCNN
jgi:hypothetical protein